MIISDLLCSNVTSRYIHHLMHPAFEKDRECKYVGGLSGTIHLSGGGGGAALVSWSTCVSYSFVDVWRL